MTTPPAPDSTGRAHGGGAAPGVARTRGSRGPVRAALIVVSWLAIGVVITVLVAWALATWTPRRQMTQAPLLAVPQGMRTPPEYDGVLRGAERREFGFDASSVWIDRVETDETGGGRLAVWSASRWRVGLPWRALGCTLEMAPDAPDAWRGAIPSGKFVGRAGPDGVRRLPIGVALPGFAADSAFWGVLAWLVVRGPRALRRRSRARRGLCRRCEYPVGVSPVCTECGAEITPLAFARVPASAERWAARLAAAGALGALTTVCVAGAIAATTGWIAGSPIGARGVLPDGTTWDVRVQGSPGAEHVVIVQSRDFGWTAGRPGRRVDAEDARLRNQWAMSEVPAWAAPLIPGAWRGVDDDYQWGVAHAAYGWPWRSMAWMEPDPIASRVLPPNVRWVSHGVVLPASMRGGAGAMPGAALRALPLMALPRGFALNSAFFGAAWLLVIVGVAGARARARRRRTRVRGRHRSG